MIRHFTTKRDIIGGFANAMNLISPEVEAHHEKVSYLACRLAEEIGMDEKQRMFAFAGGLLHDVGGVLKQGSISLLDLERSAGQIASAGAALLGSFPLTSPFAQVVQESQTPWQRLKKFHANLKVPQQIGQIIHLADTITLLLDGSQPVLNQIGHVQEVIGCIGKAEFSPEVLSAFQKMCGRESVWMDVMYRPQFFLELIDPGKKLTEEDMKEFSTSDANETEDRGKTAEVNLFQSSDRPIVRKNSMKKIRISKSFDSFRKLRQNRVYYVDKTMLLQEYLVDNFKEGVLFARPRRFGKTLTMTMFRDFLDIRLDSRELFSGLKIMEYPETVDKFMNRYPVVFLSLKELYGEDFDAVFSCFRIVVSNICKSMEDLGESGQVSKDDKILFSELKSQKAEPANTVAALDLLTRMLCFPREDIF